MSIIGFIPNPETAATVVAWVQALADEDEETTFLCFETFWTTCASGTSVSL
jgi:hypothetical protein